MCRGESPDGRWVVDVFGPHKPKSPEWPGASLAECLHVDWFSRTGKSGVAGAFQCAYPVAPEQITFRWDLPNGTWGLYVGGQCWAFYAHVRGSRKPWRLHWRADVDQGPRSADRRPFTEEEILRACTKKPQEPKRHPRKSSEDEPSGAGETA